MNDLLNFGELEKCEGITARTRQRRILEGTYKVVEAETRLLNGRREKRIALECLSTEGQARWRALRQAQGEQMPVSSEQSVVPCSAKPATQGGEESSEGRQTEGGKDSAENIEASHGGQVTSLVGLGPEESPLAADECALPAVRDNPSTALRAWAPASHAGVPLLPDGTIDRATMEANGMARHLKEFDRRLAAVVHVRAKLERASYREHGVAWQIVAAQFETKARTLQGWDQTLTQGGTVALVPTWGLSKRGKYIVIPEDLRGKILEAWSDFCGRTPAQVFRTIVVPWCREQGIDVPSISTIERFVNRETRPIEEAAFRVGPREFKAHFAAKVERDIESVGVGEWFVADHRKFDVMVLEPLTPALSRGERERKAIRPWITLVCDIRTAGFVGYRLCEVPSAVSVAHAVRSAMLSVGIPKVFLRDNGKEFTARRLGGKALRLRQPTQKDLGQQRRWPAALPAELEGGGLWAALGVEVVTSLPYHAWSKPIESFMGAFARMWENMIPGYTGRDAKVKPEILARHLAQGKLLTWEQFEEVVAGLFTWWNEEHMCGERTETAASSFAKASEDGRCRIPQRQALDVLLQDQRTERVRPHGIKLNGLLYQSVELGPWVGLDATVRWDPGDPGEIIVYTPDGTRIAVPQIPKANYGEFSEANAIAKRVERGQRAYLAKMRAERTGHCTEEELDPTGAFRQVQERIATSSFAKATEDRALQEAGREAEKQLEARERAEQEPKENPFRAIGRRYAEKAERWRDESYASLVEKARTA